MDIRLAGKRDGIDAAIELFRGLGIRCIFATARYDKEARERALTQTATRLELSTGHAHSAPPLSFGERVGARGQVTLASP